MATACTEAAGIRFPDRTDARNSQESVNEALRKPAPQRRMSRTSGDGSGSAEQAAGSAAGERKPAAPDNKEGRQLNHSYSNMGSSSTLDSPRSQPRAPGPVTSEGSCSSDLTNAAAAGSPVGLPPYSPFMMFPSGPPIPGWRDSAAGSPAGMPGSPMSPGSVLGHPPFGGGGAVGGAPGSPHGLYPPHRSSPFMGSGSAPSAPSPLAGFDGPPSGMGQLPPFYMQAAAATAAHLGGPGSFGPHLPGPGLGGPGLGGALGGPMDSVPAYLSAYSNSPMGLEQQLSHAAASLSLDGSLPQFNSLPAPGTSAMAAAILQQQHYAAAALRRSFAAQSSAAALGLAGAGLGPSLHHMAALQHLSAASASAVGMGPQHHHLSRLRQTHSADYSPADMSYMAAAGRQQSRFKPRRSSEPKLGPDGQPRLNARQRRTLRRAKERALKGLMEASVSLLNVHGVQVELPQDSHLTAVMAAADKEAEQAEDAGYDSPLDDCSGDRGTPRAAASGNSKAGAAASSGGRGGGDAPAGGARRDSADGSAAGAGKRGGGGVSEERPDCVRSKGRTDVSGGGGSTRARDLAVAADELETSVRDLALAAVAAVAAVAEGKDISQAAVAAQQAAAAAVTAASVLPPGYSVPDDERISEDGGGSQFMGTAMQSMSAPLPPTHLGMRRRSDMSDAPSSRVQDAKPPSGRHAPPFKGGISKGLASMSAGSASGGLASAPSVGSASSTTSTSSTAGVGAGKAGAEAGAPGSSNSGNGSGGVDIERVIDILHSKGKAGAAEDRLIRDLQIIQSLIGALKAPLPPSSSSEGRGSRSGYRGHHAPRRSHGGGSGGGYSGSGSHHNHAMLHPSSSLPH